VLPPKIYKSFIAFHQSPLNTQEELHQQDSLNNLKIEKDLLDSPILVLMLENFLRAYKDNIQ